MAIRIRRREFIVTLGGAAAVRPLAARAQQPPKVSRIGAQALIGNTVQQMPRYRFTIRDGDRFDDEEGVVLRDDFAARTYAIGIIQELENASNRLGRSHDGGHPRWSAGVGTCGVGRPSFTVTHHLDAPRLCQHHQRSTQITVAHGPGWAEWTALALSLGKLGNIRTQTLPAFSASDMKTIIGKMA